MHTVVLTSYVPTFSRHVYHMAKILGDMLLTFSLLPLPPLSPPPSPLLMQPTDGRVTSSFTRTSHSLHWNCICNRYSGDTWHGHAGGSGPNGNVEIVSLAVIKEDPHRRCPTRPPRQRGSGVEVQSKAGRKVEEEDVCSG